MPIRTKCTYWFASRRHSLVFFLQGTVMALVTLNLDWEAEAKRAMELVNEQGITPGENVKLLIDGI
jgi:hypothetical protein